MITSAFLSIVNFFLNLIVGLFPSGTGFPSQVHTASQTVGGYVGIFDPIFPLDTLYQIIILVIIIEIAILGFKSIKWLVSYIPFVGGRG